MRTNPRITEFSLRTIFLVTLTLTFAAAPVVSQKRGSSKRGATAETDNPESRQRRKAITLLVETANRARLFDDLFYRARVQTVAADALWTHDTKQARAIFRRAWEAATASDKAEREEAEQPTGTEQGMASDFTEARNLVLRNAAARDARLADEFLRELTAQTNGKEVDKNQSRSNVRRESNGRRLMLANELLEDGQAHRAAEIAAPLANEGTTVDLLAFILRLRQQDVTEGNALYLNLLQRATADPQNVDANTVLLLSAPVVSPSLLVIIDEFGSLQFRALSRPPTNSASAQPLPQRTQSVFFRLAAAVLSRPLAPRPSLSMQALMAQFYATGRLLPYFESPTSSAIAFAPALRARHSEIFNEIESARREQFSAQFDINSLTPAGFVDPLRSEAEQLARTTDAIERRRLSLTIIKNAVRNKFWDRARRAVDALEDADDRRAALSYLNVHQIKDISNAYADEKDDDHEGVAKFVRNADAPAVAKAWGLSQVAIIAARSKDTERTRRVAELINEAESYAARVSNGTAARVAGFGILTLAAAKVAPSRAWELLSKFIEAANSSEEFMGDEIAFDMTVEEGQSSNQPIFDNVEAELFRSDAIFATMADLDFEKALAEAQTLDDDVPQAFAVIAISRRNLENPGRRGHSKPVAID